MSLSKVINLFAGPGAGKSTLASGVFYHLKSAGLNCELVTEFAKDLTWSKRNECLKCQPYILGKQYNKLFRLNGKVDYIITDSPLLLSVIYNTKHHSLNQLAFDLFNEFNNINFFVIRVKDYLQIGRSQTFEESLLIDQAIINMLNIHKQEYINVFGSYVGVETILKTIQ